MSPNGFTYQSTLQLLYTIVSNTPEIFPVLLVIALFVHFSWYAKTKKKAWAASFRLLLPYTLFVRVCIVVFAV